MNKDFLESQMTLASQRLGEVDGESTQLKQELSIVTEDLSSLLHPENYPESQKEDLRKLALELGYEESTDEGFHPIWWW